MAATVTILVEDRVFDLFACCVCNHAAIPPQCKIKSIMDGFCLFYASLGERHTETMPESMNPSHYTRQANHKVKLGARERIGKVVAY